MWNTAISTLFLGSESFLRMRFHSIHLFDLLRFCIKYLRFASKFAVYSVLIYQLRNNNISNKCVLRHIMRRQTAKRGTHTRCRGTRHAIHFLYSTCNNSRAATSSRVSNVKFNRPRHPHTATEGGVEHLPSTHRYAGSLHAGKEPVTC